MSNSKVIVLKNKEVKWAFVNHTTNKYDSSDQQYSINVVLTDKEFAKLQKMGLQKSLKNVEGGKGEVQFTKDVISSKGVELTKPKVYDKHGRIYYGAVGNGSICDISIYVGEYKPGKFTFKYNGLKVNDLVEYDGGNSEGFEFEDVSDDEELPFDLDDSDDFDVI
jgi:hypothetical protein